MNLLTNTIIYMLLSIIFVILVDYIFEKKDFRDYKAFTEKHRFVFQMTILSILYMIYAITLGEIFLPISIIAVSLCLFWIWFFIMDIDLKFYRWYEKIILLSITVIVFISLYFSIEYILLLGLTKGVKNDLCDNYEKRITKLYQDIMKFEEDINKEYILNQRMKYRINQIRNDFADLHDEQLYPSEAKSVTMQIWNKKGIRTNQLVIIKMIAYKDMKVYDTEHFAIICPSNKEKEELYNTLDTFHRLEVDYSDTQHFLNSIGTYINGCKEVPLNFDDMKEISTQVK